MLTRALAGVTTASRQVISTGMIHGWAGDPSMAEELEPGVVDALVDEPHRHIAHPKLPGYRLLKPKLGVYLKFVKPAFLLAAAALARIHAPSIAP